MFGRRKRVPQATRWLIEKLVPVEGGFTLKVERNLETEERIITVSDEAGEVLTQRESEARWMGHCWGALIVRDAVARAAEIRRVEAEAGAFEGTEAFNLGTQAGELGHAPCNPYIGAGFAWRAFEAGFAFGASLRGRAA